jgi:hypothetical protein
VPESNKIHSRTKLVERINFAVSTAIPIDYVRDFSWPYRFSVGTVLIILYIFLFTIAVYYFFSESTTTQFIALEEGSNTCSEVVRPIEGTFHASSNGLWEGDAGFKYSESPIKVIFRQLSSSTDSFLKIFEAKRETLNGVNAVFSLNNLARNVLYWTSFKKSLNVNNKVQSFQFVGDPSFVFNAQVIVGVMSSGSAFCLLRPDCHFNTDTASFEMSYPAGDYVSKCQTLFDAYSISFAVPALANDVHIMIDTRSFMIAMAVNTGVAIRETNYDFEVSDVQNVTISGTDFGYFNLIDTTRYPGMTPILCLEGVWCVVKVGLVIALPIFDHYGDNLNSPSKPCDW